MTPLISRLRLLTRRLRWHRRKIAGLCAGVAVFAALQVLRPPTPPTVSVPTARHDLSAGSVLSVSDIIEVPFPADLAPSHRLAASALVGRTVNAATARGTPLTGSSVAGDAWSTLPAGFAAVPVRISDASIAALLEPGQKVNLAAVDPRSPSEAQRLTSDAVVLSVAPLDPRSSSQTGRLVVFQVPATQAPLVTASAVSRYLTVNWEGYAF